MRLILPALSALFAEMITCVALVLAFAASVHSGPYKIDDCIENQARLLLGTANVAAIVSGGDVRGIVQVCEDSRWKHICDGDLTFADATVACRQLDYGAAASYGATSFSQVQPNGLSYTPQCSGAEQSLASCTNTPTSGPCDTQVAVSCWNRSSSTTVATTTLTTTIIATSPTLSSSPILPSNSISSSPHHSVQPTPTPTKAAVLPVTSQRPEEAPSTSSFVASTTDIDVQITVPDTAGLEPVVYGALTAVATVMTMSTAVLAVGIMWRLVKSRRRRMSSADVEVRELETNPAYQTIARLIPSSPNEAYTGTVVNTQPVHLYEDVM